MSQTRLTFLSSGMGHSTSIKELDDVEAFLRVRLLPNAGKGDKETLTSLV